MTAKKVAKKVAKKTTKKATRKAAPKAPPPPAPGQLPEVNWGHQTVAQKDEAIGAWISAMNTKGTKDKEAVLRVVRADEAPNPYFLRRPVGPIDMDIHLGGGFPAGGCCMVSGPDNAGKTWLVLK